MSAVRAEYRHGRIIGAYLLTTKGKRELHPAIILTPDEEIIQPEAFDPRGGGENSVVVIGVSSKFMLYPNPCVKLPFRITGHPVTRLNKDSAAILGWYDVVHIPDECRFWGGDVPAEIMVRINNEARKDIARRLGQEFATFAEVVASLLNR